LGKNCDKTHDGQTKDVPVGFEKLNSFDKKCLHRKLRKTASLCNVPVHSSFVNVSKLKFGNKHIIVPCE